MTRPFSESNGALSTIFSRIRAENHLLFFSCEGRIAGFMFALREVIVGGCV